jgi:hypothetical protein
MPGCTQVVEAAMSLDLITGKVTLVAQTRNMGTDAEIPQELFLADTLVAGKACPPTREQPYFSEALP